MASSKDDAVKRLKEILAKDREAVKAAEVQVQERKAS